ncbi:MAG: hypothetical protein U1E27_04460, partial [Kiritimatiellia bacterium]|nr:hypothetical protein [Kiritimatiellia bacterium]
VTNTAITMLAGSGHIRALSGGVIVSSGSINLGLATVAGSSIHVDGGRIETAGRLRLTNSTFSVVLNAPSATPMVSVGGELLVNETDKTTLQIALGSGFDYTYNEKYTLISYGSLGAQYRFADSEGNLYSNGDTVSVDGQDFELSYADGGNFITLSAKSGGTPPDPEPAIFNPYRGVNWTTYGQHKANLHTHTLPHKVRADGTVIFVTGEIRDATGAVLQAPVEGYGSSNHHPDYTSSSGRAGGSDGTMPPQDKIAAYHSRGYSILALTDHNMVTWPWEDHAQNPSALGMLAVQGCEPSRHHHMSSFFNSYNGSESSVTASLAAVKNLGGLSILYHPGRYTETVDWYVEQYETHDHLVGMEVYNQGNRYPNDRALWDQVLTRLMPHRPVWGYSNDDAHSIGHVSRNWQTFLLPELTEAALRHAMTNGHFYFSYAPGGHPVGGGDPAPVIHSIAVNDEQGIITLDATGHTNVLWISGGATIASGSLSLDVSAHQGVIRAVLIGPTGRTYTQPFFAGDPEAGTPDPFGAIPVGPEGTALQTFAALPALADGWFTMPIAGSSTTVTNAAGLDALIQATPLALQPLGETSAWPAVATEPAQWNSAQQRIQTRPTVVAATALIAALKNETGSAVSALTLAYDFGSWLLQEGESVYG